MEFSTQPGPSSDTEGHASLCIYGHVVPDLTPISKHAILFILRRPSYVCITYTAMYRTGLIPAKYIDTLKKAGLET